MFEELSNVTDPTGRGLRLGKPHPCNLIHFDANPAPAFCAVRSAGSGRPRTFFLNEPKTPPNGFGGARPGVTRWTTISQMGCRYPAQNATNTDLKLSKRLIVSFWAVWMKEFRPSRK